MTRALVPSLLGLALALPLAASAADLDYSYLEGGYVDFGVSDGPDAEGWLIGGSAAITDHVHLYGSYLQADIDNSNIFEADVARFGVGWNTGISDNSDLVVRANYLDLGSNFPGADSDGYEAEVGVRSGFSERFETYAAAGYIDSGRGSGDLYGKLGAQYKFSPRWGVVADATLSDDANQYFVGPRLSF
jgi:Ax21 family sulfation-dependent quorum factor